MNWTQEMTFQKVDIRNKEIPVTSILKNFYHDLT